MKSSRSIIVISLAALLIVSAAVAAPTIVKSHGKSVHGQIAKLDSSAKTFTVTTAKNQSFDLQWNDATKVTGGSLKDGEAATVRYMVRDGKNVATSVMITAAKKS